MMRLGIWLLWWLCETDVIISVYNTAGVAAASAAVVVLVLAANL